MPFAEDGRISPEQQARLREMFIPEGLKQEDRGVLDRFVAESELTVPVASDPTESLKRLRQAWESLPR